MVQASVMKTNLIFVGLYFIISKRMYLNISSKSAASRSCQIHVVYTNSLLAV